MKPTKI